MFGPRIAVVFLVALAVAPLVVDAEPLVDGVRTRHREHDHQQRIIRTARRARARIAANPPGRTDRAPVVRTARAASAPALAAIVAETRQAYPDVRAPGRRRSSKPQPTRLQPSKPQQRPLIVVDAGHGGRDHGASTADGRTREKDVVLGLANRLQSVLHAKLGARTALTRTDDRFLSLQGRVAQANASGAALFISVHANAHADPRVKGVETYYFGSRRRRSGSGVQLARAVQQSIVRSVGAHGHDLGIKPARFRVLRGVTMPAVLVEVGFLTNPEEAARLLDPAYQDKIVAGIVEGVRQYFADSSKAAAHVAWGHSPGGSRPRGQDG